ncbi:phosphate ABC transporter substrate-binding protein [Ketobacter sp. MCCC 1A13808]|uniref:substrate-binding domain-containing protein n=1 Tax=Ketobacter sp. MCCC 1A13808 TaxID=2602738 RepID=UPI000F224C0C|nr:substrate-binding domain-containing protein [Ketobacter sp. MCCC 1A13808]MVF13073.1 phosphate ABC transporter substrate-binding protein [Ketobacter sp. MCCC 1A13808]RLP53015.1 MAG: phosphate ABC transporter substrate-binding protein [Ketobacter sp.]
MKTYLTGVLIAVVVFGVRSAFAANPELVIIVNSNNGVESISSNEVADIFLGKSQRLPDGTKVVPLDQDGDGDVRQQFYDKVVRKSVSQLNSYWSRLIFTGRGQPPFAVTGDSEVLEFIASNPNMIGYVELAALQKANNSSSIKVLLTIP